MPMPPFMFTVGLATKPILEWCKESGLAPATIRSRLKKGWEPFRAVTEPADKQFRGGGRPHGNAPRPAPKLKEHSSGQAYMRLALRFLNTDYGDTRVDEFRPATLRAIRTKMFEAGYARKSVNGHVADHPLFRVGGPTKILCRLASSNVCGNLKQFEPASPQWAILHRFRLPRWPMWKRSWITNTCIGGRSGEKCSRR